MEHYHYRSTYPECKDDNPKYDFVWMMRNILGGW